jgi:hypothetical protein
MYEKDTDTTSPIGHDPRQMELPFQDTDGKATRDCLHEEGSQAKEERVYGKLGTSFTVDEIETHEDGSATYQISASDEDMHLLFETFFLYALINGIQATQEKSDSWLAEREVIRQARRLVNYLDIWEECDELDYSPSVKIVKQDLKRALEKTNGKS